MPSGSDAVSRPCQGIAMRTTFTAAVLSFRLMQWTATLWPAGARQSDRQRRRAAQRGGCLRAVEQFRIGEHFRIAVRRGVEEDTDRRSHRAREDYIAGRLRCPYQDSPTSAPFGSQM